MRDDDLHVVEDRVLVEEQVDQIQCQVDVEKVMMNVLSLMEMTFLHQVVRVLVVFRLILFVAVLLSLVMIKV